MEKEKVIVSACLLGINCKYNGENNKNDKVIKYLEDKEVIPICPEIYGGLPTPRNPAEQVGDKVITNKGIDVTDNYLKGAEETLKLAKHFNIKKAILKAKSPSCGVQNIYDGSFTKTLIKKDGIKTKLLKKKVKEIIKKMDI